MSDKLDQQLVESIFADALGREGDELTSFLDERCQGNEMLKTEVEALLRADQSIQQGGERFLRNPRLNVQHLREPSQRPVEDSVFDTIAGRDSVTKLEPPGDSPASGQPHVFGDYVIHEELARGGMGVVYLATQKHLDRQVALKMILAGQLAGDEEVRRFHAEAAAAAKLEHPNIVSVYESGTHAGQHFYSMAYVAGPSFKRMLREGVMSPRRGVELLLQVTEAIDAAHQQQVVHRDLKPANILLTEDDTPRVTDFGLAKQLTAEDGLTLTGQVMGTPSYMSPEQARGDSAATSAATDIYSIGAILYEVLTGRPPHQSANAVDTLRQVLELPPIRPRQLNPAIDKDIETICLKCIEKEPTRRFESARALADDLRRYLENQPIAARPISRVARAFRWCQRQPMLATMIGLTSAVLLVSLVSTTTAAVWANQSATLARNQTEVANQNYQLANARAEQLAEARRQSDLLREQAESQKELAEEQREQAETLRQAAEKQRQVAESQRELAEKSLKNQLELYLRPARIAGFVATAKTSAQARSYLRAMGSKPYVSNSALQALVQRLDETLAASEEEFAIPMAQRRDSKVTRATRQLAVTARTTWSRACNQAFGSGRVSRLGPPPLTPEGISVRQLELQLIAGKVFDRLNQVANKLASSRETVEEAVQLEFWQLYHGEIVFFDAPRVETALRAFADELVRQQSDAANNAAGDNAALKELAEQLDAACASFMASPAQAKSSR